MAEIVSSQELVMVGREEWRRLCAIEAAVERVAMAARWAFADRVGGRVFGERLTELLELQTGRTGDMSLSELRVGVEKVAQAVGRLEPRVWAGWVQYMMEVLDSKEGLGAEDRREFLDAVREDLEVRLAGGRW